MPKQLELKGTTFGFLKVLNLYDKKDGRTRWLCKCICGNTKIIFGKLLTKGVHKSCGCKRIRLLTKHGMSFTSEYKCWKGIKARCFNINSHNFKNYGGRGITVCDEWHNSFEQFYKDMGPRPSKEHSIDRIDNDKGYSKENCRWATKKEQSINRSFKHKKSRFIGVSFCQREMKWRAYITFKRKQYYLGYFKTEHLAAKVYNDYSELLFGKNAYLNKGSKCLNKQSLLTS